MKIDQKFKRIKDILKPLDEMNQQDLLYLFDWASLEIAEYKNFQRQIRKQLKPWKRIKIKNLHKVRKQRTLQGR